MNKKLNTQALNRLTKEEFKSIKKIPVVIVLDNIRSLNNIGSVFRTADAFLIEAIYLCGITATPPHREIQKTALGATETVVWKYFSTTKEAINDLQQQHFQLIAVEQTEKSVLLNNYIPKRAQKIALIFGNEVDGVGQSIINAADFTLEIPQEGTKHSLNIAVSVGIVVWDIFAKLNIQTT